MKFLSKEEIENLKKIPERKSRIGRPKTEVRDHASWFKQPMEGGHCGNPKCIDPRPSTEYPTTMVAKIPTGETICRYCFLAGYGT